MGGRDSANRTGFEGCSANAREPGAGRVLPANLLPHSPPRLLQPPSLEGREKERQFGDYQSSGFHFQGAGWGRLLPGGLSGPLPDWRGPRVGPEAWAVGREGGRAAPTAQNVFFSQSWQAARFLIGSRLRASLLRAFPHHLNPIGNPAPWLPIGPVSEPDAEGPLWLPSWS